MDNDSPLLPSGGAVTGGLQDNNNALAFQLSTGPPARMRKSVAQETSINCGYLNEYNIC